MLKLNYNYLFAMVSIVGIAVLLSCQKQDEFKGSARVDDENKSAVYIEVDPANENNPYDYVGYEHNEELLDFVDAYGASGLQTSGDVYNHFYEAGLPSHADMVELIAQLEYDPDDYTGLLDSLYAVHADLFDHYFEVMDIVNDTGTGLQEKVNLIRDYEAGMNYGLYSSTETMALQAMFSVARYSLVLWATPAQGGLGCGQTQKVTYIGGSRKFHTVVMSDIGGTLTSALFTGNPFIALGGGVLSSAWSWAFYE